MPDWPEDENEEPIIDWTRFNGQKCFLPTTPAIGQLVFSTTDSQPWWDWFKGKMDGLTQTEQREREARDSLMAQLIKERKPIPPLPLGPSRLIPELLSLIGTTATGELIRASEWWDMEWLRNDPDVGPISFIFAEYRTRGDLAVRPTHRLLDGLIVHWSWPGWKQLCPPCGAGCRCCVRWYMVSEAKEQGWLKPDGTPAFWARWPSAEAKLAYQKGLVPDSGWRCP